MNNKKLSIKTTSTVFLAIILVAGTIALSSSSFMTTANALSGPLFTADNNYKSTGYQPEYAEQKFNSYESTKYEIDSYEKPSYRNDNYQQPESSTYIPEYKPQYSSYGQDSNSYKSKDSSSVFVKKLNCNNINVNLNGLGINATGADAADDSSIPVTDAIASQGYGENNGYKKSDNGFKFVCINNNNNTVIIGNGTTTPEPLTCVECFTEFLTPSEIAAVEEFTEFTIEEFCPILDADPITESGFRFFLETEIGVEPIEINNIVECLIESGIEFEPEPPQP